MGIEIEWYKNRRDLARFIYSRDWTWDDLNNAVVRFNQMAAEVNPRIVHVIIDMSGSKALPYQPWQRARRIDHFAPPNEGMRLVVGASKAVEMAYKAHLVIDRMTNYPSQLMKPGKVRLVRTLREAEAIVDSLPSD